MGNRGSFLIHQFFPNQENWYTSIKMGDIQAMRWIRHGNADISESTYSDIYITIEPKVELVLRDLPNGATVEDVIRFALYYRKMYKRDMPEIWEKWTIDRYYHARLKKMIDIDIPDPNDYDILTFDENGKNIYLNHNSQFPLYLNDGISLYPQDVDWQ